MKELDVIAEVDAIKVGEKPQPRLIVIDSLHHQSVDGHIVPSTVRFYRFLDSDEQPFIRYGKVSNDWQGIETGWLKGDGVGMLSIHNTGNVPLHLGLNSTWAGTQPLFVILPNESMRGQPVDLAKMQMRTVSGEGKYTLILLPR